MTTAKRSTDQAVLDVLSTRSKLTAVEIAAATKRGKSTISKALARLERDGTLKRAPRKHVGGRRMPDRCWKTHGIARAQEH